MFKTENTILSSSEREGGRSTAPLSQSAQTDRPIPPLVGVETLLRSGDGVGGVRHRHTDRKEIALIYFKLKTPWS
jgi:hypothetical protein